MGGNYDAALHLETFLCLVKEEAAVLMSVPADVFWEFQISTARVCFLTIFVRTSRICIPATELVFHKPFGSQSIASS